MLPVEFLTIPDRISAVLKGQMRAPEILAAILARDPGKPAPTVNAIRATLSRSPLFRRVRRGLWEKAKR